MASQASFLVAQAARVAVSLSPEQFTELRDKCHRVLQRYYGRVCPLDRSLDTLDDGCIGIVVDGVLKENAAPEEKAAPKLKAEPVVKVEPEGEAAPDLKAIPEEKAAPKVKAAPVVKAEPVEEAAFEVEAVPEEKETPKIEAEPEEEAAPKIKAESEEKAASGEEAASGEKAASRLRRELGAMEMVHTGQTITFTMPVRANDQSKYFKLDVHVSPPGLFKWQKTAFNHLRMWLIVSEYIRYIGFSSHDSGLYLNLHETETGPCRSPGCRLHLTSDPGLMMLFFDLDPIRFAAGFQSLDELFAWATRSKVLEWRNGDLIPLTPRDDRRLRKAFRREWLPQRCPNAGVGLRYPNPQSAKRAWREKALIFFNKGYAYKTLRLHPEPKPVTLWTHIAGSLPLGETERYDALLALMTLLQWADNGIVLRPKRHLYEGVPRFWEHGELGAAYIHAIVVPWARTNWRDAVRLFHDLQARGPHDPWRGVLVVQ